MRGRNLGSQTIIPNIDFSPILAKNCNVRLYSQWCCGTLNLKLSFSFGKSDGKCDVGLIIVTETIILMIASRTPWSLLGCWTVVEDKQGHLKKKNTLVRAPFLGILQRKQNIAERDVLKQTNNERRERHVCACVYEWRGAELCCLSTCPTSRGSSLTRLDWKCPPHAHQLHHHHHHHHWWWSDNLRARKALPACARVGRQQHIKGWWEEFRARHWCSALPACGWSCRPQNARMADRSIFKVWNPFRNPKG